MKLLLCVSLLVTLTGCNMDYEEYTKRVEYCTSFGLEIKESKNSAGDVIGVVCIDSKGNVFPSKYR